MWDARGMDVVKRKYYETGRSQDEHLKLPSNCLALRRPRFNDILTHRVLDLMFALSRMAKKKSMARF